MATLGQTVTMSQPSPSHQQPSFPGVFFLLGNLNTLPQAVRPSLPIHNMQRRHWHTKAILVRYRSFLCTVKYSPIFFYHHKILGMWSLGTCGLLEDINPTCDLFFQLDDKVIEELEEQVGRTLSAEALHGGRVKGPEDHTEEEEVTINGLIMKYPRRQLWGQMGTRWQRSKASLREEHLYLRQEMTSTGKGLGPRIAPLNFALLA